MREIVAVDGRNRISLGKHAEEGVSHYIIDKHDDGSITLTPAVIMPVTVYRSLDEAAEEPAARVRPERPRRSREPVTLRFSELDLSEDHGFIMGDSLLCATHQEHLAALTLLDDLRLEASFWPFDRDLCGDYSRVTVTGNYMNVTDATATRLSEPTVKVDRVA